MAIPARQVQQVPVCRLGFQPRTRFPGLAEKARYTMRKCLRPVWGPLLWSKESKSMIRFAKALVCVLPLGASMFAQEPKPQAPASQAAPGKDTDKAGAYYNFAMGRLYAQLAGSEGNKNDYINKAIQHYKEALRL